MILQVHKKNIRPIQHQSPQATGAGFTLIEALLYIALFALIIGGGFAATQLILQGTQSLENKAVIEAEGNFLLRKIDWGINGFSSINKPSGFGDTLEVEKPSGTFTFFVDADGDFALDSPDGIGKLSSNRVDFSDFLVQRIGGTPESLHISFKLNDQQFGTTTHYIR